MLDPTTEYTLALALEDFVPVLLSAAGLVLLARWLGDRDRRVEGLAVGGAVLVGLGGLSKATWKLLVAGPGVVVPMLDNALFPLIATGFTLVLGALWMAGKRTQGPRRSLPWVVVALVAVASVAFVGGGPDGTGSDAWRTPWLILAVVSSTAVSLTLIARARDRGDALAGVLFAMHLIAMFALAKLAGADVQTLRLQWIEQSISTAGQAAFFIGVLRFARNDARVHELGGVHATSQA